MIIHFMNTPFIQDGATPLHVASQEGHLPVVTILLEAGSSITAITKVSTNRNVPVEQRLFYRIVGYTATHVRISRHF